MSNKTYLRFPIDQTADAKTEFKMDLTPIFPTHSWESIDPLVLGWSDQKLSEAKNYFDTLPPANLLVIVQGRVVVSWGAVDQRIKVSSVRKSILSALYGIYEQQAPGLLDTSLAVLGIDDVPPLTATEAQATPRMLLQSRSGIYHPFVAGTPAMKAARPPRGSHRPGTHWYYNNWDFNALGTIFERVFEKKIAIAFRESIAQPTQMEDFRLEDMYYLNDLEAAKAGEASVHPAYHFKLSARDMARFGYLYLNQGKWLDQQIIPESWVKESTHSYSETGLDANYGYLWWVDGFDLNLKNYSARGSLSKYIVNIPDKEMTVIYQNHTELPDSAQNFSNDEFGRLAAITKAQMGNLLKSILAAKE